MDLGVCPSIAGVALVGVEHAEAPLVEDAECLRRFAIVLVGLRCSMREGEVAVEEPVGEGKLDKLSVGENLAHFSADGGIEPIVVVNVEKAAVEEVGAQPRCFFLRKDHIAVPRQEEHRVLEDSGAGEVYRFEDRLHRD